MDAPISKSLKITFLVHMILAGVFGAALFLIPGRTFYFIGWANSATAPPIITRLWGAALLALAVGSFLGWRASRREQVSLLVPVELVYSILVVVAVLAVRFLAPPEIPIQLIIWVVAVVHAAFAVAWGLALRR